jgi:hypothetical protein
LAVRSSGRQTNPFFAHESPFRDSLRATAQAKQHRRSQRGLASNQAFGRIAVARYAIFPRFAWTPARPLGGSSCFWVLVAPNQARITEPCARRRLSKAIRVNAGALSCREQPNEPGWRNAGRNAGERRARDPWRAQMVHGETFASLARRRSAQRVPPVTLADIGATGTDEGERLARPRTAQRKCANLRDVAA